MRIYFEAIKEEGLRWDGSVEINPDMIAAEIASPGVAHTEVEIFPVKNYFRIKGSADGEIKLVCTRCLESFDYKYKIPFELYLVREPLSDSDEEIELKSDDLEFSFNHGEFIDLQDVVSEQLALNLPLKQVCNDECKGLCSNCGKNMNTDECDCKKKGDTDDHPFAALKSIKIEKKH
jgi:uncharacterized protein